MIGGLSIRSKLSQKILVGIFFLMCEKENLKVIIFDQYKDETNILIPNPNPQEGKILFDNEAVANFPISEGTYGIVTICMNADLKFFCRKSMKPLQPGFDEYTVSKFIDREIKFSDFLSRHLDELPNCFAPTIYRSNKAELVIDMLLMPIGNLGELIEASRIYPRIDELLSEDRLLIILFGIAVGLDSIHSNLKCVYRDLKPDNVLLDHNFYPFLCDFGSLIPQKDLKNEIPRNNSPRVWDYLYFDTQTNTPYVGSFQYMSPSILFQPYQNYTPDVDIYSFGLTAYYLLTKRLPFRDIFTTSNDPNVLAKNIANSHLECDFGYKYQHSPDFYEKMKIIIEKCTMVNPNCTLGELPSATNLINMLLECSDYLKIDEQANFQNYAGTYIRQANFEDHSEPECNGKLYDKEYFTSNKIGQLELIYDCSKYLIGFPLYTMAFITYFGMGTQQNLKASSIFFKQASEIDYRNSKKLNEQIINYMNENDLNDPDLILDENCLMYEDCPLDKFFK